MPRYTYEITSDDRISIGRLRYQPNKSFCTIRCVEREVRVAGRGFGPGIPSGGESGADSTRGEITS